MTSKELIKLYYDWRKVTTDLTKAREREDELFAKVKAVTKQLPEFGNKSAIESILKEHIGGAVLREQKP